MYTPRYKKLLSSTTRPVSQIVVRYFDKKDPLVDYHLHNVCGNYIESELNDTASIQRRFSERGIKPEINLIDLKELYVMLKRQTLYHNKLQQTLTAYELDGDEETLKKRIKVVAPKPVGEMDETELKKYYVLRQIDDFEKYFLRLRAIVLNYCFSLPNELHENTPRGDTDEVLKSKVREGVSGCDHIHVGHRLSVLEYWNPACYYLINEAANLEMALQRYISDLLMNELNFKPFRNPDTCHDFLTRGVYVDNIESEGLALQNSFYRLVGGASFIPFCAYKTGSTSHIKFMPERFFTCGRRYISLNEDANKGLYTVVQRTNIQSFIATSTEKEIYTEYENIFSWLISLYERLGLDFRVCNKRASALHRSENFRTSIQLYSAPRNEFIDAAHISFSGDFISRRLNVLNHDKDKNVSSTWLLDIVVLSVPAVLAHLLERSSNKLLIPDCILPYMYKVP